MAFWFAFFFVAWLFYRAGKREGIKQGKELRDQELFEQYAPEATTRNLYGPPREEVHIHPDVPKQ